MTIEELAERLAEAIAKQTEIDNLGDGESIILMAPSPILNLKQIAEEILKS